MTLKKRDAKDFLCLNNGESNVCSSLYLSQHYFCGRSFGQNKIDGKGCDQFPMMTANGSYSVPLKMQPVATQTLVLRPFDRLNTILKHREIKRSEVRMEVNERNS
ncbi:hypothetical protein CR513_21371, partial [Mucuna pruriens]